MAAVDDCLAGTGQCLVVVQARVSRDFSSVSRVDQRPILAARHARNPVPSLLLYSVRFLTDGLERRQNPLPQHRQKGAHPRNVYSFEVIRPEGVRQHAGWRLASGRQQRPFGADDEPLGSSG